MSTVFNSNKGIVGAASTSGVIVPPSSASTGVAELTALKLDSNLPTGSLGVPTNE